MKRNNLWNFAVFVLVDSTSDRVIFKINQFQFFDAPSRSRIKTTCVEKVSKVNSQQLYNRIRCGSQFLSKVLEWICKRNFPTLINCWYEIIISKVVLGRFIIQFDSRPEIVVNSKFLETSTGDEESKTIQDISIYFCGRSVVYTWIKLICNNFVVQISTLCSGYLQSFSYEYASTKEGKSGKPHSIQVSVQFIVYTYLDGLTKSVYLMISWKLSNYGRKMAILWRTQCTK